MKPLRELQNRINMIDFTDGHVLNPEDFKFKSIWETILHEQRAQKLIDSAGIYLYPSLQRV